MKRAEGGSQRGLVCNEMQTIGDQTSALQRIKWAVAAITRDLFEAR